MKYWMLIITCLGMLVNLHGADKWKLSEAVIVADPKAPENVKLASGELKKYIQDITKQKILIINPSQAEKYADKLKINIGVNSNLKDIPELSKCEYDGAWIKTLPGNNLLISGRSPKGTEFGIYVFLEKYCGVRWFLPGKDGTFIPENKNLSISKVSFLSNPFFLSRSFSSFTAWPGFFPCPESEKIDTAWRRHNRLIRRFHCSHNIGKIIRPSVYKKTHPEYFPMNKKGVRYIPPTDRPVAWQPCMTNKEVIDICAKAATKYFDKHPDAISFSLGVNDWGNYCQCPKCKEVNGGEKYNSRGLDDYSRLTFSFANEVAKKMPERHKNKYLGLLAYANTRDYPEGFKFEPNVMIQRTTASICYFNPNDKKDLQATLKFAKNTNMFSVYEYWYGTGYMIPNFGIGLLEDYIDTLVKHNTRGWNVETCENWSMDGIKYYLLAQKLWNPKLKFADILHEFCVKMFGNGSADMLKFYKICQEKWESQTCDTTKYHLQNSVNQVELFDVETCKKLIALLNSAYKKVRNKHGKKLIAHQIRAITFTLKNAEVYATSKLIGKNIDNAERLSKLCIELIIKMKEISVLRDKIRSDVFAVIRGRTMGGLGMPIEMFSSPLYQVCLAQNKMNVWQKYLEKVKQISADSYIRASFYSKNKSQLEKERNLLKNGDFSNGTKDWVVADWGSAKVKSKTTIEKQDGKNACLMEGLKYCFMYAPSPGISQKIKLKAKTWYMLSSVVKAARGQVSLRVWGKDNKSCRVYCGEKWYPARFYFKTSSKAGLSTIRVSTGGLGKIWINKVELKEIPALIAKHLHSTNKAKVYPPLSTTGKLPEPLKVDFSKKFPPGVYSQIKKDNGAITTSNKDYVIVSAKYNFKSCYDLKIKVKASSPDKASLLLLGLQYKNSKTRLKNGWFNRSRVTLSPEPKVYEFIYKHDPKCRYAVFNIYRFRRKGKIKIEGLEFIPIFADKKLFKKEIINKLPLKKATKLPERMKVDFSKKLLAGVYSPLKNNSGILSSSDKDYLLISTRYNFNESYDLKIKIKASSPDKASLLLLGLQYKKQKSRIKNGKFNKSRVVLSPEPKVYEFIYKHNPNCSYAVFNIYRFRRKGKIKIEGLELIPIFANEK